MSKVLHKIDELVGQENSRYDRRGDKNDDPKMYIRETWDTNSEVTD